MPIKKKKIVEKVVAFEGEQDFIVSSNKPEYISAGEVLFVNVIGTSGDATPTRGDVVNQTRPTNIVTDASPTSSQSTTTTTTQTSTGSVSQTNTPSLVPCDAVIDQFNISVSGSTATISTTIRSNTSPTSGQVRYSLDGGDAVTTSSTFQLTNLSAGSHSISVAAVCNDGSTSGKQVKTFNIPATIERPSTPRVVDPSLVDQLQPPVAPTPTTPTTTVTSTTTFIPPFGGGGFGGGFGGGGGGSTETTETKKKDEFPLLLVLLIAGGLFLITRKRKKN